MAAFEGFSAAHGQTQISNERRAGKKANSFIVRKPLTIDLIRAHLNGTNGVFNTNKRGQQVSFSHRYR